MEQTKKLILHYYTTNDNKSSCKCSYNSSKDCYDIDLMFSSDDFAELGDDKTVYDALVELVSVMTSTPRVIGSVIETVRVDPARYDYADPAAAHPEESEVVSAEPSFYDIDDAVTTDANDAYVRIPENSNEAIASAMEKLTDKLGAIAENVLLDLAGTDIHEEE